MQFALELFGARTIRLVHKVNSRNLHQAGLHRVDVVTLPRCQLHGGDIGQARNIDRILTHADRLYQDRVVSGRIDRIDKSAIVAESPPRRSRVAMERMNTRASA
jgi:hypothetical protein